MGNTVVASTTFPKMLGVGDYQANWLQSVELAAAILNN